MQTEIGQWGNSIAMRIPTAVAKEMGFEKGVKVSIVVKNEQMIVVPRHQKMSRKERLARIIADLEKYGPDEIIDWGPDVGNEIIE